MSFLRRQVITAALTANAYRPLPGFAPGAWSFFPGWLTGELAPHLMAVTATDALLHVGSSKKGKKLGLALAAANVAAQALLVKRSGLVQGQVEDGLTAGLGADYTDRIGGMPPAEELATPWRRLVNPFNFRNDAVVVERNIAYGDAGKRNLLDIYRPADHADLRDAPVLLQVHGGGWTIGEKEQQALPLMQRMAAKGWVCVSINYRLSPRHEFPAHIIDVKKAIAWVKENIASYGGDPNYVVITGGSAGGHLSSLAAVTANDPAWQPGFEDADTSLIAAVPFYGVYDMAGSTGLRSAAAMRDKFLAPRVFKKRWSEAPEEFEAASPILRVTEDAPDFLVLHGANDTLVDVGQARAFVAKLKETSSKSVTYVELPGAQHAFDIFPSVRSEHGLRGVDRWLSWHHAGYLAAAAEALRAGEQPAGEQPAQEQPAEA